MSNTKFEDVLDTKSKDSFWRYAKLLPVGNCTQISSQQTKPTVLEQLGDLLLKREDQSITGSHKWRSLVYQLSCLKSAGVEAAVLSSSGNAAISASHYAAATGVKLFVFLSDKTPVAKLAALTHSPQTTFVLSSRPLRLAKYVAAHYHLSDLRPSVDTNAITGFQTLGYELYEQDSEITNIFTFITSGASLRGIANAYQKLVKLTVVDKPPRLYGVYSSGELAGGLSGRGAEQLDELKTICEQSGGALVEVADAETQSTQAKVSTSTEGAASLAAAEKVKPTGKTVVILTGCDWPAATPDLGGFEHAENFAEVDKIIASHVD